MVSLAVTGTAGAGEKKKQKAVAAVSVSVQFDDTSLTLPELSESSPVRPESTFAYRVTREITVTPTGPLTEPGDGSVVTVGFTSRELRLKWENGVELIYQVSGHEPIAETQPDRSTKLVAALRGFRIATSGSVENVIVSINRLIITAPGAATAQVTVVYASAIPPAEPVPKGPVAAIDLNGALQSE